MPQKYCHYCRRHKPAEGFRKVLVPGRMGHNNQCAQCHSTRQKPRSLLEQAAEADRVARRAELSATAKRHRAEALQPVSDPPRGGAWARTNEETKDDPNPRTE